MSSDYRLGPRGCQRSGDAISIAVPSEFADANEPRGVPAASTRCCGIWRVHTKIRMQLHFYSMNEIQIGLPNKFANRATDCFPREMLHV